MAPHWWLLRAIIAFEVCGASKPIQHWTIRYHEIALVANHAPGPNRRERSSTAFGPHPQHDADTHVQILRQPGFHRAVGRVHRAVNERKYGRDPNEPLSQGEATGAIHTRQTQEGISYPASGP